jgi:hypothetical protein
VRRFLALAVLVRPSVLVLQVLQHGSNAACGRQHTRRRPQQQVGAVACLR